MLLAVDPLNIDDLSNKLKKNGISNWIIGNIDKIAPGLVRVSENVENIEVTKY